LLIKSVEKSPSTARARKPVEKKNLSKGKAGVP